jgi:hypothetical protein
MKVSNLRPLQLMADFSRSSNADKVVMNVATSDNCLHHNTTS